LGSAVPAFFGLLKFYISAIFTAIIINGIYPLWAMNFTCENYNFAGKDSCLKIIFFYYIDFNIELSLLVENGRLDIAQVKMNIIKESCDSRDNNLLSLNSC
jgi:hypothetical protein